MIGVDLAGVSRNQNMKERFMGGNYFEGPSTGGGAIDTLVCVLFPLRMMVFLRETKGRERKEEDRRESGDEKDGRLSIESIVVVEHRIILLIIHS